MASLLARLILLSSLIAIVGCAPQMHASRGWSYIDDGNYESAIAEFELAGEKGELPGIFAGLSRAYLGLGDKEKAQHYLEEGLKRYPKDGHLNFMMGIHLMDVNDDPCGALQYFVNAQNSSIGTGSSAEIVASKLEEARQRCRES